MSTNNFLEQKLLIRSASTISFATLLSRVLGFLRDITIARFFGVYHNAEAFVVAFKIPNLFRDLVAEGSANSVFVPLFSEYIKKNKKEEFLELVSTVFNLLLIAIGIFTILGIVFSPSLIKLIAPGFLASIDKFSLTVKLNRLLFPYLFLVSIAAYFTAILNSLKHFSIPAFGPCFLNLSIILFAFVFGENVKGLVGGVLVGGLLQVLIQIPVLFKKGIRLTLFKKFKHPAIERIVRLFLPRIFSSCIYQANNLVDTFFASFTTIVGEGSVASLYFAYRLILFPLGIFSTALNQAILPIFSTQVAEDNKENLTRTLSVGLRVVFFLLIPISFIFMFLSKQIVSLIFFGGKFDSYAVSLTSKVLLFYSIGLSSYGATKILQSCFFAYKDTLTPTKVSFFSLLLNVLLNSLLIFPLKLSGIALATSISSITSFLILFFLLKRKLKEFSLKEIFASVPRIIFASLFTVFTSYLFLNFFSNRAYFVTKFVNKIAVLGFLGVICVVSYFIFCRIFKVSELEEFLKWNLRKK